MKLFGEHIRELREKQNLPLRKVAAYLDIDTSILSKIERGERQVNVDLISKLSQFFDLDEHQLLTDYLGEEVARKVYYAGNIGQILKVAEQKAEYLKAKATKQANIKFDERN